MHSHPVNSFLPWLRPCSQAISGIGYERFDFN